MVVGAVATVLTRQRTTVREDVRTVVTETTNETPRHAPAVEPNTGNICGVRRTCSHEAINLLVVAMVIFIGYGLAAYLDIVGPIKQKR